MVVDTSVILAIYFNEPNGAWVAEQLTLHAPRLVMSTVNLTEALIRLRDRQPNLFPQISDRLLNSGIRFIAPDQSQAQTAPAPGTTFR